MRNVVIIGSGCAGNTAAIYTARANLKPLVVGGHEPGGQLSLTSLVENFPGFPEGIHGPELVENMKRQAQNFGAEYVHGSVIEADLSRRPFRLNIDGEWIETLTVIIASGASARWLGLESEQKLIGHGVSSCATCDGFFYRGKDVAVVGGGNTAVEEALYLSNLARKVTLIHRRGELRAERILQERLFAKANVEMMWNTVVDEVLGEPARPPAPPSVTGVRVQNVLTGEVSELPVDGVFIAIGHAPAVELFEGKLKQKPNGYLWTEPHSTRTDVPGVFAAGDVTDDVYRQAVTAAGLGCMAALEAEKYLAELETHREAAE